MQSNRIILSSVVFLAFLSITPSIAFPIAHYYQKQVDSDDGDRVSLWRKARFWYRIAKFSPLFWSSGTKSIRDTDLKLSESMFGMILEGSDGGFNYEDHLLFLSSREDQNFWRNQEALAQLRYGFPQKTLELLAKDAAPNADYGLMASLMTGDQESFETWLPSSKAPAGLYLFSGKQHEGDHPLFKIHNALLAPQTTDWNALFSNTPIEFKTLAIESYAQAYILEQQPPTKENAETPQETTNIEHTAVENQSSWFSSSTLEALVPSIPNDAPCALLSASIALNNSDLRQQARSILDQQEFFYTQITIGAHVFCRPILFQEASKQAIEEEEKVQWLIYTAHAQLGQHQIALAQKTLKELEEKTLTTDQTIQELYIRARAREMASDTAGMEKYARKGLETKSPVFQSLMGKSSLLNGNKSDSIWLLHQESSNLALPKDLLQEYSDLCAIAKRFGGNAIKIKINNEDVAYGRWERSKEFRAWFSDYLQLSTALPPSGTPPMPILLNNQRVDQNGLFLMRTFVGEFSDPLQISIRAMLKFNYQSIRNNSDKSEAWKEFKQARIWLSLLPFPQLFQSHPELFQIKIGAL